MMTTAPTGDILRAPNPPQRSFTSPSRLFDITKSQPVAKSTIPPGAKVLFTYRHARIVHFSPPIDRKFRSASGLAWNINDEELIGTLPWKTHGEKLMASAPVFLYELSGTNTAYLHSGPFLHVMMPKSQCWCVDGETIFALKIRGPNFYRIEMPNNSEEDRDAAEELKKTLGKVLQYETTACPFKRGFHIELPEQVEVIMKPWKPKHKSITSRETPSDDSDGRETGSRGTSSDEADNLPLKPASYLSDPHWQLGEHDVEHDPMPTAQAPLTPQTPHVETVVSNIESLKVVDSPQTPSRHMRQPPVRSDELPASGSPLEEDTGAPPLEVERDLPNKPSIEQAAAQLQEEAENDDEHGAKVSKHELPDTDGSTERSIEGQEDTEAAPAPMPTATSPGLRWLQFDDDPLITPTAIQPSARSFTEPLSLHTVAADNDRTLCVGEGIYEDQDINSTSKDADSISIASTIDSFHSSFTPLSSEEPMDQSSPPLPDHKENEIHIPRIRAHRHTDSEMTLHPDSPSEDEPKTPEWLELSPVHESFSDSKQMSAIETPTVVVDPPSSSSSPASTLRERLHQRRALSPMPPATILHIPRTDSSGRHFTTALLQKTCQLILGPSSQLLALMINIATRIASGLLSADTSYDLRTGQKIPCSWESDDEEEAFDSDEDEFGSPRSSSAVRYRGRRKIDTEDG